MTESSKVAPIGHGSIKRVAPAERTAPTMSCPTAEKLIAGVDRAHANRNQARKDANPPDEA